MYRRLFVSVNPFHAEHVRECKACLENTIEIAYASEALFKALVLVSLVCTRGKCVFGGPNYRRPAGAAICSPAQKCTALPVIRPEFGVVRLPVESKTRKHNGRIVSARRKAYGGAGRRWEEQGADISVALEANNPSGPLAHCKQLF